MENCIGGICKICGSVIWRYNEVCSCQNLACIYVPKLKNTLFFVDDLTTFTPVKAYYSNKMLIRFTQLPIFTVGKPVFIPDKDFKTIFKKDTDELFFASETME